MKKIKKIVALALATVMMMAMSITAFAEETTSTATITVESLQEGATVNIYTVATVEDDNTVSVADWAKNAYEVSYATDGTATSLTTAMTSEDVDALKDAFEEATVSTAADEGTASSDGTVSFANLSAGVYYIVASSDDATYSPMVAVAIDCDDNGNYVASDVTLNAKGTDSDLTKEADDTFVYAGEEVTFTITKTIPSYASKFVIYDYTTNLSDLTKATVTVAYSDVESTDYSFASKTDSEGNTIENAYVLDLTDIVYDSENDAFDNTYAGKTLTITYSATVTSEDGYTNEATYATNDNDETDTVTVNGFEGDITLTKTGSDGAKLSGAKFTLTKKGTEATDTTEATEDVVLTFTKNTDGEYVYDATSTNTELVSDENGIIKVVGLDEGTYQFTETEAPDGYSINANIESVTITAAESSVSTTLSVEDSTLIQLPFTGGMGTTIFTVLGVAIMAMAAALFFATKRKNAK